MNVSATGRLSSCLPVSLLRFLVLSLLLQGLQSCAWMPPGPGDTAIIKSDSDPRAFRYRELPNGLRLLLVSDPRAERAAASLDLHVGNRNDPDEFPGLAHFLEHMLFLGTERYPGPDEWHRFIGKHGGRHNAYTSFEHTNYYFSVASGQLDAALDRFADFFVAALLDERYVQRELRAVEAEFRARIDDEQRRILDALREVINPAHPLSRYSGGNLQTLDKPGLQAALRAFYRKWYTAGRMTLAVSGPQSLDALEAMAAPRFAVVAAKGEAVQAIAAPLLTAQHGAGKILAVQTRKPMRQLQLSFPMPDLSAPGVRSALMHIGNVIGHEGEGSLHSALKRAGLIESLSVGGSFDYRGGSLYQVTIALSERGMQHIDRVVQAFYYSVWATRAELNNRRDAALRRYREQAALAALQWRYYTPGSPLGTVTNASASMHQYPPEDLLYGPYRSAPFDASLLNDLLQRIAPEHMLMVFAADQLPAAFLPRQQSRWYAADYSLRALPPGWQSDWAGALEGEALQQLKAISMPAENRFIPRDFTLFSSAQPIDAPPQRAHEQAGFEAWFKVDDHFETPRADVRVAFLQSTAAAKLASAKYQALSRLYALALGEQLQESIYPAYLAGQSASFYPTLRGFTLRLSGYSDKLPVLLEEIIAVLPRVQLGRQRFGELVAELERNWTRELQALPHQRLAAIASAELYPQRVDRPEMIAALRAISYEDFATFASAFWPGSYQRLLLHGNANTQMLQQLVDALAVLPRCDCSFEDTVAIEVAEIDSGVRIVQAPVAHSDHGLYWYFQSADQSIGSVAIAMLTAATLEPGLFAELRTEQQLGYIVSTRYLATFNWPGVALSLQSPGHDARALATAVDDYLTGFLASGSTEAQYLEQRSALVQRLREEQPNMHRRSDHYWVALMRAQGFEYREQLADAMQRIGYTEWLAGARALLAAQHRRSLQLQGLPR